MFISFYKQLLKAFICGFMCLFHAHLSELASISTVSGRGDVSVCLPGFSCFYSIWCKFRRPLRFGVTMVITRPFYVTSRHNCQQEKETKQKKKHGEVGVLDKKCSTVCVIRQGRSSSNSRLFAAFTHRNVFAWRFLWWGESSTNVPRTRSFFFFFFLFFTQHSCPLWYRPKWCKNHKTCRNVIFQLSSRAGMAGGGGRKRRLYAPNL